MINIVNYKIDGFQNEAQFVNYLHGKRVKDLEPIYQDMLRKLYGDVSKWRKVKAVVDKTKKKYDIVIQIGKEKKKISIKKGINNSMHVEGISTFIHFLFEMKIDRENVMTYLKYHYADGTTNGKGTYRMSAKEYKEAHQEEINELNRNLNHPYILRKAIERFVLLGRNSDECIDGLIYGVVNDFIFLTREEVIQIIEAKRNVEFTGIHFGPLCCQPMTRNLNYNPLYEKKRFCVQIKWYDIYEDTVDYVRSMQK